MTGSAISRRFPHPDPIRNPATVRRLFPPLRIYAHYAAVNPYRAFVQVAGCVINQLRSVFNELREREKERRTFRRISGIDGYAERLHFNLPIASASVEWYRCAYRCVVCM